MHKHPTHKRESGFTLIEMLTAIAIIAILAAIGIPKYNEYKIRGYDAHSKQALHDMHKLCNAYWIDTNPSKACDLSTIKSAYYGFTQNPDIVATLPPSPRDNFCGSAKHKDSSSTYSIDSAAVISPGNVCVVESPVKEASLPTPIEDDPPETTPEDDLLAAELAAEEAEAAAELARKEAEEKRLAEEERIKYESCENLGEELHEKFKDGYCYSQNQITRRGTVANNCVHNNPIPASFIPNEMFTESKGSFRDTIVDKLSGDDHDSHHTQNPKSKGWCVWRMDDQIRLRRPGCEVVDVPGKSQNCDGDHFMALTKGTSGAGLVNSDPIKDMTRYLKCSGRIKGENIPGRYGYHTPGDETSWGPVQEWSYDMNTGRNDPQRDLWNIIKANSGFNITSIKCP
jgi:prepilin-type N-terminal cleavage/methylation domain-containing protein